MQRVISEGESCLSDVMDYFSRAATNPLPSELAGF